MEIKAVVEYCERGSIVFAQDYPGAFSRGKTVDEALAKLSADVDIYCLWAGIDCPGKDANIVVVQSVCNDIAIQDADSEVLFDIDRTLLSSGEYERLKLLVLKSATDLQCLYDYIPDKNATDITKRHTFYGNMPRTASEMLAHINGTTGYYISRLGIVIDELPTLIGNRALAFRFIEAQPDYLSSKVFTVDGEQWTLKKVLRRFLWHDRIHAKALYRMAVRIWNDKFMANPFKFGMHTGVNLIIKPLTVDLTDAYLDFFDNRVFSDGNPCGPCYCNAPVMDNITLCQMESEFGGDVRGTIRRYAAKQLDEGQIHGYLAFDGDKPIGWCNAGDMDIYLVNKFNFIPETARENKCGRTMSVVCFAIAPEYRGMGVATALLECVVSDAKSKGYYAVEGYAKVQKNRVYYDYSGPLRLYEKIGFIEAVKQGDRVVMRKEI